MYIYLGTTQAWITPKKIQISEMKSNILNNLNLQENINEKSNVLNNKICDDIHNDNSIDAINKKYDDENLEREDIKLNNDELKLKNDTLVLNNDNSVEKNKGLINENSSLNVSEKMNIPSRSLAGMREVSVRDFSDSKVLDLDTLRYL
jgi:hypothetical protein